MSHPPGNPQALLCADEPLQADFRQMGTQARHVNREGIVVDEAVAFPQGLHDVLPGNRAAPALEQKLQNAELVFRQLQLLAVVVQRGVF